MFLYQYLIPIVYLEELIRNGLKGIDMDISYNFDNLVIYRVGKALNEVLKDIIIDEKKIKGHDALQLAVNDVYTCVLNIHKELEYINDKC